MSRSDAHDVRNAAFRKAFETPFEFKSSLLPTADLIAKEAKKLGLQHEVQDIPSGRGARIHWLGDRSAKRVLLYFHGEDRKIQSITTPYQQSQVAGFASPRSRGMFASGMNV